MSILLLLLLLMAISAYAFYLNNKLITYSKDLNRRENMLKNEIYHLADREKELKEDYNTRLANILRKDCEIKQRYADALVIERTADKKIELLQQQIYKLKTEINNARQKSKKLAEKNQKLV